MSNKGAKGPFFDHTYPRPEPDDMTPPNEGDQNNPTIVRRDEIFKDVCKLEQREWTEELGAKLGISKENYDREILGRDPPLHHPDAETALESLGPDAPVYTLPIEETLDPALQTIPNCLEGEPPCILASGHQGMHLPYDGKTVSVPASSIPRMSLKEFRDLGVLQELNRQFLHPLGLGLEITCEIDADGKPIEPYSLSGVWDYRDDDEGLLFGGDDPKIWKERVEKAAQFSVFQELQHEKRRQSLGYVIQNFAVGEIKGDIPPPPLADN